MSKAGIRRGASLRNPRNRKCERQAERGDPFFHRPPQGAVALQVVAQHGKRRRDASATRIRAASTKSQMPLTSET